MVGENRKTDRHSRGGIPASTNVVCLADDAYSSVSRDASSLDNPITRLEDETGNSNSLNREMSEENGILAVTKFLINDEEEEPCSLHLSIEMENTEVIRKDCLLVVTDDCTKRAQAISSQQVEMNFVDKKSDDICKKSKANDIDCQAYISVQEGSPDGWVDDVSMGNFPLVAASELTNHAFHQSNTDHSDKVITNKDLTVETVNQRSGDMALNTPVKSRNEFTYERLNEVSLVETKNTQDCMHGKYRNDLSIKKPVGDMVSEGVDSKGTSNSLASISDKFEKKITPSVNTDLLSSDIGRINMSNEDSSQYSVECDNGIKLYVDLKNRTPMEFRKAENYEFCSSERTDECNSDAEPLQLHVMKGLSTSEDTYNLAEKKMLSNKAILSNPLDSFGDRELGTPRLGCVASTSPKNITKKIEPSRELRRASSILIPPHGANRCLSPSFSHSSRMLSSPLFPHGASRFLSPYSTGGICRQQACKEQQIDNGNQLKESFMPETEQSSKVGENFCTQSRALESKLRTELGFTNTTTEETVMEDTCTEVGASKGPPINNPEVPDVKVDHGPFNISYMKNLKNEPMEPQDSSSEMEFQHSNEKDIERFSQIKYLVKENKETKFSKLMEEMEAKEQRIVPRYKHGYKKSPPFKKLRYMKTLARILTLRKGILDSKRSPCMVSASSSGAGNASGDSTFAAMDDRTAGNAKSNQFKKKNSGWPFLGFGKKRYLERALAESTKRLQIQKMLRSGIYDRSIAQKEDTEVHNSENTREISKPTDHFILDIFESGNEVYNERVIKQQKRRQEQFKTSLLGKPREKAKKTAKKMALYNRNQILRSKRENASTNLCTDFQGEDNDVNEVSA